MANYEIGNFKELFPLRGKKKLKSKNGEAESNRQLRRAISTNHVFVGAQQNKLNKNDAPICGLFVREKETS